jgi:hypothetical protein
VSSPINNYGVNINIGDYVSFSESTKEKREFRLYLLCFEGQLAKPKNNSRCAKNVKSIRTLVGPYPFTKIVTN